MFKDSEKHRELLIPALIIIAPMVFYITILSSRVPYYFSRYFSGYSFLVFILAMALYAGSYYTKGWRGWFTGISLTVILFALALSYKWASGYSNAAIIGGLLPYKDSNYYYNGARAIATGHLIPAFNLPATWRPLFPGFLSILLVLTNFNFQISLAILTAMTGIACYISSRQILTTSGFIPAAIYMTLLFFYIPVGFPSTELLGFAIGCLALFLLWQAAHTLKIYFLIAGLITLVTAISIRAGTFFVLPLLLLWAGYVFRKEKRFSFMVAGISLVVEVLTFVLVNILFQRWVVQPGDVIQGNFAYVLYGQVMGGTGWTRAYQDLGTGDTSVIFQAAFQVFIHHPLSFFIAAAKSYRDFFLPGFNGVFYLHPLHNLQWWDITLWIIGLFLLVWGIICIMRRIREPLSLLLFTTFVGIMLSIPFLPPIDGGNRFYAGTIPFLFALMAFGLGELVPKRWNFKVENNPHVPIGVLVTTMLIIGLNVIFPPILRRLGNEPTFSVPICSANQVPFAVQVNPGTYIDLVQTGSPCGMTPEICLGDFEANGVEKKVDDFYRTVVNLAQNAETNVRLFSAKDLIGGKTHYFLGEAKLLQGYAPDHLVTGCAIENRTKYQNIYQVISTNTSSAVP